jgi:hypothetical protein
MRYTRLGDRDWLQQKYEEERLSAKEIAELIGCSRDGVRIALLRHGFVLRTSKESNRHLYKRRGFRSKYKLLQDKDWLKEQYVEGKLGLAAIADLVGATNNNSVRQALKYFGIPIRGISDGLTLGRMEDGFVLDGSVLTGCLLGDGYFQAYNRWSNNSYPKFCKKNKFLDHIRYVAGLLSIDERRIRPEQRILNGKVFTYYRLCTFVHKSLSPIYREWYPLDKGFKKAIPKNVEINKVVLLHWFLDDGSSQYRKRKYLHGWTQRKKQIKIVFSSQSFTREDQEMLCSKVNDRFGLGMKTTTCNTGTGWVITIPQSRAQHFFDIIGPPPVSSLAYKWKI